MMRYWMILLLLPLLWGCKSKVDVDEAPEEQAPPWLPAAPSGVSVVPLGSRGMGVHWLDRSDNESGFEIRHGVMGRDTFVTRVPTNTTTWQDTIVAEGHYFCEVRAVNDSGASHWIGADDEGYCACPNGMIPLRVGNWWDYRERYHGTEHSRTFRRIVHDARVIQGNDWFMLVDSSLKDGRIDTVCYLRNFVNGVIWLSANPDSEMYPDTLFMYPQTHASYHYHFLQDSIVVLHDPPGAHVYHGDSLFYEMDYQRFKPDGTSIIYRLLPHSIGLVYEATQGAIHESMHSLINYHVED